MTQTINVVGAGIAGSLTARYLRSKGYQVRVIDDADKFSASAASSNLFIRDWYDMKSLQAQEGFELLENLFPGQIEHPFTAGIRIAPKMQHIPQRHLLVQPDVIGTVTYADDQGVSLGDTQHFDGPVVLCMGYRHNVIAKSKLDIEVFVGHRFLFEGNLAQGKLDMVAPYKHGKLYQYAPGVIYYADSVKVLLKTYEKKQEEIKQRTLERAKFAMGKVGEPLEVMDFRVGYRPVIKSHPMGYLMQESPNVFAMNGGGKNGTVAYAGLAVTLEKELSEYR